MGKRKIRKHIIIAVIIAPDGNRKGRFFTPEDLSIAITEKAFPVSRKLSVQIISHMHQAMILKPPFRQDIAQFL